MADWSKAATGLNTLASQFMTLEADRRAEETLGLTRERYDVMNQASRQAMDIAAQEREDKLAGQRAASGFIAAMTDPSRAKPATGSEWNIQAGEEMANQVKLHGPAAAQTLIAMQHNFGGAINPVAPTEVKILERDDGTWSALVNKQTGDTKLITKLDGTSLKKEQLDLLRVSKAAQLADIGLKNQQTKLTIDSREFNNVKAAQGLYDKTYGEHGNLVAQAYQRLSSMPEGATTNPFLDQSPEKQKEMVFADLEQRGLSLEQRLKDKFSSAGLGQYLEPWKGMEEASAKATRIPVVVRGPDGRVNIVLDDPVNAQAMGRTLATAADMSQGKISPLQDAAKRQKMIEGMAKDPVFEPYLEATTAMQRADAAMQQVEAFFANIAAKGKGAKLSPQDIQSLTGIDQTLQIAISKLDNPKAVARTQTIELMRQSQPKIEALTQKIKAMGQGGDFSPQPRRDLYALMRRIYASYGPDVAHQAEIRTQGKPELVGMLPLPILTQYQAKTKRDAIDAGE